MFGSIKQGWKGYYYGLARRFVGAQGVISRTSSKVHQQTAEVKLLFKQNQPLFHTRNRPFVVAHEFIYLKCFLLLAFRIKHQHFPNSFKLAKNLFLLCILLFRQFPLLPSCCQIQLFFTYLCKLLSLISQVILKGCRPAFSFTLMLPDLVCLLSIVLSYCS